MVPEGETPLPEFIEIENLTSSVFDIAGWKVTGGVDYTFPDFSTASPNDSFLVGRRKIVVCQGDPGEFRAAYGLSNAIQVFGPWTGSLDNAGERITLRDKNGVVMASVRYDDEYLSLIHI